MSIDDKIDENTVRLVAFGPGFGESIALYIPEVGWGVIDSCLVKNNNKRLNPTLEYLKSNNVNQLAFLVLTHPHQDHYLGIDHIIKHYLGRIERVCYYSGQGIRKYRTYLAKNELLGERGIRQLANIFSEFEKAKNAGANIITISERTEIIRRNKFGQHYVEIVALSPSAESEDLYSDLLFGSIPKKDGDTFKLLPDSDHNLISAAIWCSIGNLRIILGSDVETGKNQKTGWIGILDNVDCPDLSSQLIKVSHHGSPNAFYKNAWEKHSSGTSPVAIITPYNRLKNPLPSEKGLRRIAKYSEIIGITSKPKYVKPKKVYDRSVIKKLHGIRDWKCLVEYGRAGCIIVDLSIGDGTYKLTVDPPAHCIESNH